MHIHGGDIYSRKVRYDFSANLNFLGMPASVIEAACEGVRNSEHYPDVNCTKLRNAIAKKENVSPETVLCGNGAADLIFALMLAEKPEIAVLCAPTFYEYQQALETVGCQIRRVYLSEETDFSYDELILDALTEDVNMLVLCNPNNPTGQVIHSELMHRILERCRKFNIRLLLDECFVEFLDDTDDITMIGELDRYPQMIILRAFTKIYAMAGLRLGYALTADSELRRRMKSNCQPWNVSIPAQYAGVAALRETQYVETFRELLKIERAWMKEKLTDLGIRWYGSYANYIFFRSIDHLDDLLMEEGIAIRNCSNYIGLCDGFYRIAVRSHEENEVLMTALRKILEADNRR